MEFRAVESKTQEEIFSEWDALAPIRFQQITNRQDITFWRILVPNVLSLLGLTKTNRILDAGCGVGVLTDLLAKESSEVIGIDPSPKSIEIARENFSQRVQFVCTSMEDYAKLLEPQFDVVVANMVLMDVLDLNAFLRAARMVLRPGASLIFTVTHPWFWPEYYGYRHQPWFHYERKTIIESPFRITSQQDCQLNSTHVHRSLEEYHQCFSDSMLTLEVLREPMPTKHTANLYPHPWKVPRYLVGLARNRAARTRTKSQRASSLRVGF